MREIKFRAKAGTQWRYGDLYHNERGELMIYEPKTSGRTLDGAAVLGWRLVVDPETVGQYTGLKDCEGREIYEDDIVRVVHYGEESIHVIKYCDDMDYPAFDLWPHFDCDSNGLSFCKCERETTITVIGNVHDNPDLLEVEHD